MHRHFTRRSRAIWEVIAIALVVIVGSVYTASEAHASGHANVPATSPTPNTSHIPVGNVSGPTPDFLIYGGDTGQYAQGATSMAYCNGHLYTAWTGTDDHLNVAWNFNGGGYNDKVTYKDTMYYNYGTNPTTYTRPILACWRPSSGSYAGTTRLWILYTGQSKSLYLGYFDPADEQQGSESIYMHALKVVPNQTSILSPALAPAGGTLRIGWAGNGNGYLNFESTNDGSTFFSKNTDTDSTSDGGFGMTIWGSNLWFAYPGTDSSHHIYVEYYNLNAGTWTNAAHPSADYTCAICDLTLVLQGSTLRIPYSGAGLYPNLNIDSSTDGVHWNNDGSQDGSIWSAGGAVDGSNHFWCSFPNWNTLSTNNLQILQFQYN